MIQVTVTDCYLTFKCAFPNFVERSYSDICILLKNTPVNKTYQKIFSGGGLVRFLLPCAERISGNFFLVGLALEIVPTFLSEFVREFFGFVSPGFQPPPPPRKKFTPKIVGIPLQFHILSPTFIHADSLLTGRSKSLRSRGKRNKFIQHAFWRLSQAQHLLLSRSSNVWSQGCVRSIYIGQGMAENSGICFPVNSPLWSIAISRGFEAHVSSKRNPENLFEATFKPRPWLAS